MNFVLIEKTVAYWSTTYECCPRLNIIANIDNFVINYKPGSERDRANGPYIYCNIAFPILVPDSNGTCKPSPKTSRAQIHTGRTKK